ncbi:MAG TPA: zinc ribbon domain-containing protein [Solirubrobacterales bacterium]|nr:zinc ribbon domain-containing protein [Solirubrobacterales bacterium]
MLVALFGITNSGLNLFVNLVVLFLVVVYVSLIAWTYFDARRRIEDGVLVGCATAAAVFPFVGPLVYSIIRPPEYLEDAHERELEIRAAELRVRQLEEQSCPNCGHPIERTYLRCPSCRARVKDPCETCNKPIDPRWTMCPYCETPQRRAAPPPRRGAEAPARTGSAPRAQPAARAGGRRQTAPARTARPARQARPATSQQASASRKPAAPKQRKPGSTRGGSSRQPTREAPGDDRPRPATAS